MEERGMMGRMVQRAREMQENSYVPYSGFRVGSVIRLDDGREYTGCNIENVAYSPTICAERVAIFKAQSEGDIKGRITHIAVVGGRDFTYPCGVCRQVMLEFCTKETKIITSSVDGKQIRVETLEDIIPKGFTEI